MSMYKKNKKKINFVNLNWSKFLKLASTVSLAYTVSLLPAFSQQIITDGYTNTQLTITNRTTNITSSTVKGSNAFNSFSKFNVDSGNVVNLHIPSSCQNLINLVKDQSTSINGILNSVQNGKIGGNIFLVNPYGITIGSQGIVNVGSLTAITPTHDFVNSFFDAPGNPNSVSVDTLINGQVERNNSAQFINNGIINAIESVKIDSGEVVNSGEINTGAVFKENDIEIGDIVNLNNIESGSDLIVSNNQTVIISANNFVNNSTIIADGANNTNAGSINLTATSDITLNHDSIISAKGKGTNSNGGNIYIFADNNAYFENGAIIDASGGSISGDGGTIELSSKNQVIANGNFYASPIDGEAGNIIIDPVDLVINTNQIMPGANINWTADNSVTIDGAIVSTRVIGGSTDYANALSTGNSGSLTITAPVIATKNNAKIYTFANNSFIGGNVSIKPEGNNSAHEAQAKIFDTTIKADEFMILGQGADMTSPTKASASVQIEIKNTNITTNNDITISALAGTTSGPSFANSSANLFIQDSTLRSGHDIKLNLQSNVAKSGSGTSDSNTSTDIIRSTFNADNDITVSSSTTTGESFMMSTLMIGTNLENTTFSSGRDIIFNSLPGTSDFTSIYDADISAGYSFQSQYSTINAGRDLYINSQVTSSLNSQGPGATMDFSALFLDSNIASGRDINILFSGNNISGAVTSDFSLGILDSSIFANEDISFICSAAKSTYYFDPNSTSEIGIEKSTVTANNNINIEATGGISSNPSYGSSSGSLLIKDGKLNAGNDLVLKAKTVQADNSMVLLIYDNSILTAGNSSKNLVIKADGSIETNANNFNTNILNSSIYVDYIKGPSGDITLISDNAGSAGKLKIESSSLNIYNDTINITNNSGYNLVINNINNTASGQIIKSGFIEGSYTENINALNASGEIKINNTSASNLTFAGEIVSSNGEIKVNTVNDFFINGGATLNSGAANNAIVINSTNGNFFNNSGANALISNNGRWLIYADHLDDCVIGGLDANYIYNANYISRPPESITKPGNYIIFKSYTPELILTADNKSRLYGSYNPIFTYTATGLQNGDTLSEALSGNASYATPATNYSNVGLYPIDIAQGSLVSELGYVLKFVNGELTVNKANLTIKADNKIRAYDTNNPNFTASYNGFVLRQNQSFLDGSLMFLTNASKDSHPGVYYILPFGLDSNNYNITFIPGTLLVEPGGNGQYGTFEYLAAKELKIAMDNEIPGFDENPIYNINSFLVITDQNVETSPLIDTSYIEPTE